MNRQQAREEARQRAAELLQRDRSKKGYVCPICGSGSGEDGTGITTKDRVHFTCWRGCFTNADIFDIVGLQYGLDRDAERFAKVYELLNIHPENDSGASTTAAKDFEQEEPMQMDRRQEQPTATAEADYTSYFKKCSEALSSCEYLHQRGISEETARRFMVGYDAHYTKSTGGEVWQAVIIPTGKGSYVARNTAPDAGKKSRYRKTGNAQIFNAKGLEKASQPVVIVEGEIDAMSIVEAGGEAIGLGSLDNVGKLLRLLETAKAAQPFILALDNETEADKQKAVEAATRKLEEGLQALGLSSYRLDAAIGYHDANEALQQGKEALQENLRKIAAASKEGALQSLVDAEKEKVSAHEWEAYREKTNALAGLQNFINGIAESANTPAIPTGFSDLDKELDGGLYEGLYSVGAISSLGKTTFVLQMCDQIAAAGHDVLIFSLEMSKNTLMARSISRNSYILAKKKGMSESKAKTSRGITAGAKRINYGKDERQLIDEAIMAYAEYAGHVFISEGIGNIGAEEVRQTVERHILLTGGKWVKNGKTGEQELQGGRRPVVVVDYLQILAPYNDRATDKQNTDNAVVGLKRLSRDFKLPVIAISSFNRMNYKNKAEMEAFKESGSIEYSSDVIFGLQLKGAGKDGFNATEEKRKNPRQIELVILKNREAALGDPIEFEYRAMFNHFMEVGEEWE